MKVIMITMTAIMRITATTDPPMVAAVEKDADENKKQNNEQSTLIYK